MVLPVFAAFPVFGEYFSSHWNVVIAIGLAFFVVQIALSVRLYRAARQQARILAKLCRDYERGGDGRGRLRSIPKDFAWLRWVLAVFPSKSPAAAGNFARDDVLNELDTRIASSSAYLLLQRLGVMAPLLGVILTVVGFFWLDVKASDDQSLQGILLSVTPLVIGVGAGAALALVNQALLYVVGGRIEALRMLARTWFDTVIWNNVGLDSQAATSKAIAAVDRFTRALVASADRHTATSDRIEQSTASMQNAASLLRDGVESFHAQIKDVPQALCDVRNAAAAGAEALQELIPVGTRAVANLDVSVAAFRTTIDREFAGAAKRHDSSSKALAESVREIRESAELLRSGSAELKLAAQSNSAAYQSMDESLRHHLVPGTQRFYDAIHTLTSQIADWSHVAGRLSTNVEAMSEDLHKLGGGLLPSMTSACDALDQRIGRAVAEQTRQVESIGGSAHELRESAQHISAVTTAVNASLCETLSGLKDAVGSLKNGSPTGADIDRLSDALRRAAENADAISALSEQIRDMLEQSAGQDATLAKSRGGLRSWLSGRPR